MRAMVGLARHVAAYGLRYRLRELQLLAVPCAVALLGAWPADGAARDPFDLAPALGLALGCCLLLLAPNVLLTLVAPWADQHLWPPAALLLALTFALGAPGRTAEALAPLAPLAPAAVALALVVGAALAAGPGLAGAAARGAGAGWALRSPWRGALALPLAAGGALLAALGAGDTGWALVALAALLAPCYVWGGWGPACLVCAGIGVAGAWSLSGRDALSSGVPTAGQTGTPGFAWTGAAIALYAALGSRGLRVALLHGGPWRYIASGLAAALAAQGAVAVAAALGLLPASPVPAPFLGQDGAQVVLPALLLGLLLRLSGEAGGAPGAPGSSGSVPGASGASGAGTFQRMVWPAAHFWDGHRLDHQQRPPAASGRRHALPLH